MVAVFLLVGVANNPPVPKPPESNYDGGIPQAICGEDGSAITPRETPKERLSMPDKITPSEAILLDFMKTCSRARTLVEVNLAAGIAMEDLEGLVTEDKTAA